MREILYIKNGREYFYNPDGRIVSQPVDNSVDYRTSELTPEISEALDRARARGRYPSRELIDSVILMQEYSKLKALNYVKYKLLGEARYIDVYGEAAEAKYRAEAHYRKSFDLERELVKVQAQLEQMEKMLVTIAAAKAEPEEEKTQKRAHLRVVV